MVTKEEARDEVLRYYASQLQQIGLRVTENHGHELKNKWVVPVIMGYLEKVNPASLEISGQFNYESYREMDIGTQLLGLLEQKIKEHEAKPATERKYNLRGIVNFLPVANFIKMVGPNLNAMKSSMYDRIDHETDAYMGTAKQTFDYNAWNQNLGKNLDRVVSGIAQLVSYADRRRAALSDLGVEEYAVNSTLSKALGLNEEVKPDWNALDSDIKLAGNYIKQAILDIKTRYN